MSYDDDFALALSIQQNDELYEEPASNEKKTAEKSSLADPSWELIDPTPDVIGMFIAFDMKFFWGALKSVVIRWSKRMYSCAGICSYSGRGGLCTISLSEPLLKLRPRKDTVETLLHEMIHAYLFVTHNNRDRSGHGPEFHKHMYRINAEAGVKITVYHSFHDEVNHYKTHWWRCNGPCRSRAPYFGTVKRSSNRAPGKNDFWWQEHQMTCGGTWEKVKEPDSARKKKVLPMQNNVQTLGSIKKHWNSGNQGLKSNRGGTLVVTNPTKTKTKTQTNEKPEKNLITNYINKPDCPKDTVVKPSNKNIGNLVNVKGFKDLNAETPTKTSVTSVTPFTGAGNSLGTSTKIDNMNITKTNDVAQNVRNHWQNKFNNTDDKSNKRKLPKKFDDSNYKNIDIPTFVIDDDDPDDDLLEVCCPVCSKSVKEKEINNHLDLCVKEESVDLDASMEIEFTKEFESDSSFVRNNIINCPLCNISIKNDELSAHIELCVTIDFSPNIHTMPTQVINSDISNMLRKSGYGESEISEYFKNKKSESVQQTQIIQNVDADYWNTSVNTQPNKTNELNDDESYLGDLITNDEDIPDVFPCPVCSKKINLKDMNTHLDNCLS